MKKIMLGLVVFTCLGSTLALAVNTADVERKMADIQKVTDQISPVIDLANSGIKLGQGLLKDDRSQKALAIVQASLGLVLNLFKSLVGSSVDNPPIQSLILEFLKFPDNANVRFTKMKEVYNDFSTYLKSPEYNSLDDAAKKIERQKRLDNIFIYSTDLSILVTNLMYKVMKIIQQVGPLIISIDKTNGEKVDDALNTAVQIMDMLNKTNDAMKRQVVSKQQITPEQKAEIIRETPKADVAPMLDF